MTSSQLWPDRPRNVYKISWTARRTEQELTSSWADVSCSQVPLLKTICLQISATSSTIFNLDSSLIYWRWVLLISLLISAEWAAYYFIISDNWNFCCIFWSFVHIVTPLFLNKPYLKTWNINDQLLKKIDIYNIVTYSKNCFLWNLVFFYPLWLTVSNIIISCIM